MIMEKTEKKLNESIINIRVKLQNTKIKKSGKNNFAGFDYYELSDFLPKLNELMLEEGVNDVFTIEDEYAKLILIKGEEKQEYKIPFVLFETPYNYKKNKNTGEIEKIKSMQDIQYLGALNTYYKRYLYLNAFGITDGEIIDSMNNEELIEEKENKKIDYHKLLQAKLKEMNINIPDFAKRHKLSMATPQEEVKDLLEKLAKGEIS
jgi:hypothetical protein